MDTRAAFRTFKGKDGNLYSEFLDKEGKTQYLTPMDLYGKSLAFPGQQPDENNEVVVSKDGTMQRIPVSEVDYTVPDTGHILSPNLNITNMSSGFQPARSFYSAKYHSQYIPQQHGEVPLVQTMSPDGVNSYQELFGKKVGAISAPASGVVTKVTDEGIYIKDTDGKVHEIDTVKNFPFNRMTAITYTATAKVGDKVKEGDMIASSNFVDSKTGALNTGQNLSVAIMPYKGMSFEDAYVISEGAAKRMTTEKMFEKKQDIENDNVIGKKKFVGLFPSEFTNKQLDLIDDNGVIKKGTIVEKGDPIILSTRPKTMSTQDKALGKLHKVLSRGSVDTSVSWDHDAPGEVIDVARTRKGSWKVNIKSVSPAAVGDKLCFTPDHEIMTLNGWVYVDKLKPGDTIIARVDSTTASVIGGIKLEKLNVYDIDEEIYTIDTDKISLAITKEHKMYIQYITSFWSFFKEKAKNICDMFKIKHSVPE